MTLNTASPSHDIAILGGTFDPIHMGHINSAHNVADWLSLTEVILLPAHIPPHKVTPSISSKVRAEMVELVCHKSTLFQCDARELNREKPSYTVDTLNEFNREHSNARLFFLIGMDSLLNFTTWHKWQDILTLCHIVVSSRPGYDLTQLPLETKNLLQHYQASLDEIKHVHAGKVLFAPSCQYDISSTEIRQRIKSNQSLDGIVPEEIAEHIVKNKLYT